MSLSLYSVTKILEAEVQVLVKPNTDADTEHFFVWVWIVAKFYFKYYVNLSVLVIYYHLIKMSKNKRFLFLIVS